MSQSSVISSSKEATKKLKRELEGWREIVVHVHSLLLWEKTWYPGIIVAATTLISMLMWVMDPSLLSALSCTILLVTLLDNVVPTVCASLYSPAHWTGAKEKQFENACESLALSYCVVTEQFIAFKNLKMSSPKLYYSVTIVFLAALAYIGNKVNNLLLAYILVTFLLLMPGLHHHGILHKYYQLALHTFNDMLKSLQGGNKLKTN